VGEALSIRRSFAARARISDKDAKSADALRLDVVEGGFRRPSGAPPAWAISGPARASPDARRRWIS